jgi:UDP-N-acetylmuramate dehydrogenase
MKVIENCCLTSYNSYKIESFCSQAFFPESEEDLIQAVEESSDYILIGSGHNLILSKSYYDSNFIILNNNFNKVKVDVSTSVIEAEAGASFYDISTLAMENSLSGIEFCYDIPSSVGGGVIMNAGTKEGEIKNVLLKVRYLDVNDMVVRNKASRDLKLSYRNSLFQNSSGKIVLKAWFELVKGDKMIIKKSMEASKERRWSKQPRNYPNSGSVFKRPPNKYVGPMLDELGLKGYTIGGAQVSKNHSGFIINYNNATGQDVLMLIKYIQEKVKEAFGIDLEIEQRII